MELSYFASWAVVPPDDLPAFVGGAVIPVLRALEPRFVACDRTILAVDDGKRSRYSAFVPGDVATPFLAPTGDVSLAGETGSATPTSPVSMFLDQPRSWRPYWSFEWSIEQDAAEDEFVELSLQLVDAIADACPASYLIAGLSPYPATRFD